MPLLASTNELVRILGAASNLAYISEATNLYANHTVLLTPAGRLKARFEMVSVISTEYELLSKLAECLIGSRVRVRRQEDGSYLYTNEDGHPYIIRVIRDECGPGRYRGVFYLTGRKLFSNLRALVHLESRPGEDGGIEYGAQIFASSGSGVLNFFARIPFIRNMLMEDVATVVSKFDAVYYDMLKDPKEHFERVKKHRDPAVDPYFTDREIEITRRLVNKLLAGQPAPQGSDR